MSHGITEEVTWRLATLMEEVGPDRFKELEDRLRKGTLRELDPELNMAPLDGDSFVRVFEAARDEYNHGREIDRKRKELHQHIAEAQRLIGQARLTMRFLDEIGDVEYEGGHADTEHHLNEAERSLRAAQAVKPTDKNGE